MKTPGVGAAVLVATAIATGAIHADGPARIASPPVVASLEVPAAGLTVQPVGGGIGPDLICGSVGGTTGIVSWGQDTAGQIVAYSIGTNECNIGTEPVSEMVGTSNHVIGAQNMFRLHEGRFEHIGQKWVLHGFCALQLSTCATCTPYCPGCCDHLGVGCTESHSAQRQGDQFGVGPKSAINPATGFTPPSFVFPVPAPGDTSGNVHGRLQVHKRDLYSVNFPGARYFGEVQHIAADDAAAGNDNNNASWREAAFAQPASPAAYAGHIFPASLLSTGSGAVSGTNREEIALFAWQEFDTDPDNIVPVALANADVPSDGRFILGYKVLDRHDGTYTYEYAIHNLNSDRSGQAVTIPLGNGVVMSNIGFHDVDWHSANGTTVPIYSGTDWSSTVTPSSISWSTETFAANPNANALRWGTLYNYRFTASTPPVPVTMTLSLFKPGSPADIVIATVGPSDGGPAPADLNGDGVVDTIDLGILLASWTIPPATSCDTPCPADINHDGVVNSLDLGVLLSRWTV